MTPAPGPRPQWTRSRRRRDRGLRRSPAAPPRGSSSAEPAGSSDGRSRRTDHEAGARRANGCAATDRSGEEATAEFDRAGFTPNAEACPRSVREQQPFMHRYQGREGDQRDTGGGRSAGVTASVPEQQFLDARGWRERARSAPSPMSVVTMPDRVSLEVNGARIVSPMARAARIARRRLQSASPANAATTRPGRPCERLRPYERSCRTTRRRAPRPDAEQGVSRTASRPGLWSGLRQPIP
jgi:hypothetical protein